MQAFFCVYGSKAPTHLEGKPTESPSISAGCRLSPARVGGSLIIVDQDRKVWDTEGNKILRLCAVGDILSGERNLIAISFALYQNAGFLLQIRSENLTERMSMRSGQLLLKAGSGT